MYKAVGLNRKHTFILPALSHWAFLCVCLYHCGCADTFYAETMCGYLCRSSPLQRAAGGLAWFEEFSEGLQLDIYSSYDGVTALCHIVLTKMAAQTWGSVIRFPAVSCQGHKMNSDCLLTVFTAAFCSCLFYCLCFCIWENIYWSRS